MMKSKFKDVIDYIIERLLIALVTLLIWLIFTALIIVITGNMTVSYVCGGIMLYIILAANVISL